MKQFDNEKRHRYYGVRVGDRIDIDLFSLGKQKAIVTAYTFDNNKVQVMTSDFEQRTAIAEHCIITEKVEDQTPRTFVVSDIHGAYKALIECLKGVQFNAAIDKLIVNGDVCDGYPEVVECIDLILSLKRTVLIAGNHDLWAKEWLKTMTIDECHRMQGLRGTKMSYDNHDERTRQKHLANYYMQMCPYYLDEKNRLFVHGGLLDPNMKAEDHEPIELAWERDLTRKAMNAFIFKRSFSSLYAAIFIGHTPTTNFINIEKAIITEPIVIKNDCTLINVDTCAGHGERLTILNVDDLSFFQSTRCAELYDNFATRQPLIE